MSNIEEKTFVQLKNSGSLNGRPGFVVKYDYRAKPSRAYRVLLAPEEGETFATTVEVARDQIEPYFWKR